jgi:predicted small secreted protein
MKRTIRLLLVLVIGFTLLAGCGGGGGDVLKGTWSGTYEDGDATWTFDGSSKCKLTTVFLDKEPGKYTIKNDTEMDITIDIWGEAKTYFYKIEGSRLTLTANDSFSPNYELTKN